MIVFTIHDSLPMKNITLTADEELIDAARERARNERTTVNAEFRRWLEDYARQRGRADVAMAVIEDLQTKLKTGGRKFSREEMNERR